MSQAPRTAEDVKICSVNCRGLGDHKKRRDVFSKLKGEHFHIIMLQDVHCAKGREHIFRNSWGRDTRILVAPGSSNARGAAILTNRIDASFSEVKLDPNGNFIIAKMKLYNTLEIIVVNIYAPNTDSPDFFKDIEKHIGEVSEGLPIIFAGDWNLTLNEQVDRYNYRHINNPRAKNEVLATIERLGLVDIFRERHGNERRYTWRVRNPETKQARLDFFLISSELSSITVKTDILPGYRTDHSMITLNLNVMNQARGRPLFKFNTSLLRDEEYRTLIKGTILTVWNGYILASKFKQ